MERISEAASQNIKQVNRQKIKPIVHEIIGGIFCSPIVAMSHSTPNIVIKKKEEIMMSVRKSREPKRSVGRLFFTRETP